MSPLQIPVLITSFLIPAGTIPAGERLLWDPAHLLTWDHFLGEPDVASAYAALTKIDMSIAQGPLQSHDAIELIISAELMTDGSWVKPDKRTDVILAHEQGHFDIAEYHARRLRKALLEAAPFQYESLSVDVDRIFERIFNEKEEMQREYDRETDHSIRSVPQLLWEEKIAAQLDSLSAFAGRSVELAVR